VTYLPGPGLYEATPGDRSKADPRPVTLNVRGRGEVILAGGAFNTPQLLMLSGIGPRTHLEDPKIKIDVRCNLPGVGRNLQDRYEVTFVSELKDRKFDILNHANFRAPGEVWEPGGKKEDGLTPEDDTLKEWMNHRGVYATNGVVLTVIKQSSVERALKDGLPDLFLFGLPGNFRGYEKNYSYDLESEKEKDKPRVEKHNRFTWAILKGRTRNRGGVVELDPRAPTDPRRRPLINFNYFPRDAQGELTQESKDDLKALVEGVQFARRIMASTGLKHDVLVPDVDLDSESELKNFIMEQAWGHHACGTCKIGPDTDKDAVLDTNFRVRGVKGLRVVDASVFPRIPGFFIISSIYMISEKASKVILDYRKLDKDPNDWPKAPDLGG
jgi:choline dehydrogenase